MDPDLTAAQRVATRGARAHWWRRIGAPKHFQYVDDEERPVSDTEALERIHGLAVPPAWNEVRISPSPRSRIQVIGIDGGGKLQYLYHPAFVERRRRHKFERIERFAVHLPPLRAATSKHLAQPGLTRDRVLAAIVRIIHRLHFRVGSEDGVRRNHTFGVTTLRPRHLVFHGDGHVEFRFRGKHHIPTRRLLVDEDLARLLKELHDLGGRTLFAYRNGGGRPASLRGADVNSYIKQLTAPEFSAKDFRTWAGTLLVAEELAKLGPSPNARAAKRTMAEAVRRAAAQLGNTPAVCRRAYLHPAVVDMYLRGFTLGYNPQAQEPIRAHQDGLLPAEEALLELFHVARALRLRRSRKPPPAPLAASLPEPLAPAVPIAAEPAAA